ncbi:uncharacterized protein LY79DRAFT_533154 [Colletotrichum navitas]|uniref:Uncharacterized protein n=1 Tax=Colletotrichum navitas TaxID=681940 RepID=A0AAD8VBH5_9PEZI|nr:uncharacterized protein LY79DRAFT_533154 [Colletotrichum navitas]KAK1600289.1 hypothetical protein LY79DRAFT_533154 [Colletotrichum navitas]
MQDHDIGHGISVDSETSVFFPSPSPGRHGPRSSLKRFWTTRGVLCFGNLLVWGSIPPATSIGDREESGAPMVHAIAAIGRTEIIIFLGTEVWVVDIPSVVAIVLAKGKKRKKRKRKKSLVPFRSMSSLVASAKHGRRVRLSHFRHTSGPLWIDQVVLHSIDLSEFATRGVFVY